MANRQAFESDIKTISGFLASVSLASNQYYAVTLSSGKVVICSSLGQAALGILQNAPAADVSCSVAYTGVGHAKIGGSVSQMDRLVTDTDAMLITQVDPDEAVLARALSDGSDGEIIPVVYVIGTADNSAVAERALANTKLWIGDSAGEAQAFAISGDGTMTAGGVLTITDVTVGSDATGDLLYKSSATALARLGIGTATQLLATNAGATAPEWISQSALTISDIATTASGDAAGDLVYRDAATTFERLAIGTASQILQTNAGATAPEWNSMSGDGTLAVGVLTVTDVTVGSDATGDLLYKSSATALARLAIGTASQILQTNAGGTAPEWNSMSGDATMSVGVITVTDVTLGSDAAGDVHYKTSATVTARLAIGTGGRRLTVNGAGTAPVWDNGKILKADLSGMNANDDPLLSGTDWSAVDLATGNQNHMDLPDGTMLGFFILGAGQTLVPVGATDGIDIGSDQVDNEGIEVFSNYLFVGRPMAVGRDAAFYFLIKLNIQLANGSDDWCAGFRKVEDVNADAEAYNTFFGLGANTVASPAALKVRNELNGGGADNTDTTQTIAGAQDLQIKILVGATGVATLEHDAATPGTLAAPSATAALTFDDGDRLMAYFRFLHANAAQAGTVVVKGWEVGYQ